jgi:hypothetical protein
MLRGHLDAIVSTGFLRGWAFDTAAPCAPLTVSILADEAREIAWGIAHGYREDLVRAGCATGWCAFELRLDEWPVRRPWSALSLIRRSDRSVITQTRALRLVETADKHVDTLEELIAEDPTHIKSLAQLRGCKKLFDDFIASRGTEAFVRAAYVYLLARPADASGLKSYATHLKAKKVTPYELLLTIADSEEYRARPRRHSAPSVAAFPFRIA